MKNEIREILKNAIQENAVSFKDNTAKVLYSKVAGRLQEAYKTTAKKLFSINEEKNYIHVIDTSGLRVLGKTPAGYVTFYMDTDEEGKKIKIGEKIDRKDERIAHGEGMDNIGDDAPSNWTKGMG